MLNLQERALLSAAENVTTLRELIDLCQSSAASKNVCEYSKEFWLRTLPKVGYAKIVLIFAPLKEKHWPSLVEGLAEGRVFNYNYFIDYEDPNGFPVENYFDLCKPVDAFRFQAEDISEFTLPVPGICLSSGTKCWGIEFDFTQNFSLAISHHFLLSSGDKSNDLQRIKVLCAQLYRARLRYEKFNTSFNLAGSDQIEVGRGYINKENPTLWEVIDPAYTAYNDLEELQNDTRIEDIITEEMPDIIASSWFNCTLMLLKNPSEENPELYKKIIESTFNVYQLKMY